MFLWEVIDREIAKDLQEWQKRKSEIRSDNLLCIVSCAHSLFYLRTLAWRFQIPVDSNFCENVGLMASSLHRLLLMKSAYHFLGEEQRYQEEEKEFFEYVDRTPVLKWALTRDRQKFLSTLDDIQRSSISIRLKSLEVKAAEAVPPDKDLATALSITQWLLAAAPQKNDYAPEKYLRDINRHAMRIYDAIKNIALSEAKDQSTGGEGNKAEKAYDDFYALLEGHPITEPVMGLYRNDRAHINKVIKPWVAKMTAGVKCVADLLKTSPENKAQDVFESLMWQEQCCGEIYEALRDAVRVDAQGVSKEGAKPLGKFFYALSRDPDLAKEQLAKAVAALARSKNGMEVLETYRRTIILELKEKGIVSKEYEAPPLVCEEPKIEKARWGFLHRFAGLVFGK